VNTKTIIHRIGDRAEPGTADAEIEDLDPSDQRHVLARYRPLSAQQVAELVDTVASSSSWSRTPTIERGTVLLRAAQHLRANRDRFADTVSSENGKTLREATIEVEKSADFLEYYGGLARSAQGMLLADGRPNTYARVLTEPIGLVLAICPWNDPLLTPARKLAPALVAGNHVLLKPAQHTPLAAGVLEEALLAGGLPADALGVLICDRTILEDIVLTDERIAGVTFTGSTDVGNGLRQRLAIRNVRVQTEMGGKNAAIVTKDADLQLASDAIIGGAFGQAGQRCTATSRLIVAREIHDELVAMLVAAIGRIQVGPARAPDTTMGPLISIAHRADVAAHVHAAVAAGAVVLAGGASSEHPDLAEGCFFEPTLFGEVDPAMAIWRDEVFGPVLAVHQVDSVEEALNVANDSIYGLSAAVYTRSLHTAERAIADLDAGQVSVNLPTSGWDVHEPFGGFRQSGSAFKEQGQQGLQFYTRVKTAAVRFA
jgi:acyl-CoA reductase-like NAD-dependent aldehyde dehydrogenase